MRRRSRFARTHIFAGIFLSLLAISSGGCTTKEPEEEEAEDNGGSIHDADGGADANAGADADAGTDADAGADARKPSQNQDVQVLFSWNAGHDGAGYEEEIYLLLRDGSAYEGLSVPPSDLDIKASQQREPDRWVEWRLDGSSYQIRYKGYSEWSSLRGWLAMPGKTGERLSGAFTNSAYSSSPVGGFARTHTFSFHPDGTFLELGNYSVGTGGVQAVNGVVGGASNSGSVRGTYRIDGFTIEIQRDGQSVERSLFLFTNSKHDSINIGGSAYSLEEE